MNIRSVVLSLGLLSAFGSGCVIEVNSGPYESCTAGDVCTNGTTCQTAMYSVTGGPGNICTIGCSVGEQCPVSPYGSSYAPTCVVSVSAGGGLCYDTCISNVDCGVGTRCAQIPGTPARICVPLGTSGGVVSCGGAGQQCCAGGACTGGLTCGAGNVCGVVACGNAGQACCAGGACTGAGLVCNPANQCVTATATRAPYQKCNPATEACGGTTRCLSSIAQVAGKSRGSACTLPCNGNSSVCPGFVPGAVQQSVACVNLTGNVGESQCFRLCVDQNSCAEDNTSCTQFTVGGAPIRVCVPVGPRP
jgi:hypothetical protein